MHYENINRESALKDFNGARCFSDLINISKNIIQSNKTDKKISITFKIKYPWMTDTLKHKNKQRDKFFRLHKKYPDNTYFLNQFKTCKCLCKKSENELKKKYYTDKLKTNNIKIVWDIMNQQIFNKIKSEKKYA